MKKLGLLTSLLLITSILGSAVFAQHQINGTVNYDGNPNMPMQYVNVGLYDSNNNLVAETLTDYNGDYVFNNVAGGQYNIQSSTSVNAGGIDIYDANLILLSLFNMYTLDDIQFEAADVNNSGNVTFGDYMLVVVFYIIQGQPFPGGDWQFEEVTIDLTSRASPQWITSWGVSEGDVDGTWNPSGRDLVLPTETYEAPILINTDDLTDIYIGSDYSNVISGSNINLSFPSELIEVVEIVGPNESEVHQLIDNENGILRIAWLNENMEERDQIFGDQLFTLRVRAKQALTAGQEINFELQPEGGIINADGMIQDVTIILPQILAGDDDPLYTINEKLVCYPNPVASKLNFDIESTTDNYVSISIYDLQGRVMLHQAQLAVFSGNHTISVDASALQSGHYFYQIEFEGVKHPGIHGKFIKVN